MDTQAATLLSTLKRPAASSESKLNLLNTLKSDIKHYRVAENAQATIFECIKLALAQQASSNLASSAFSTLGHLIKRLKIQDASGHNITQLAPRLFPALHDRLGDTREPLRTSASQALTELYPFLTSDVENMIREEAMGGSNPRAKQSGIQWVLKMHQDESMPFKAYTQSIVARLEDSDGNVRETAKNTIIELFRNAPDRAKADLKRQLKAFQVRHSIETQILSQIGSAAATASSSSSTSRPQTSSVPDPEAEMASSTRSLPPLDHLSNFAETINSEAAQPPAQETVKMDPLYVQSRSELDDMFREMLPHFEGKETEQNWTPRDKSILKLRRLTKGNAPSEYHQVFMAGIRSMVEGILKVANSLRTTMSTNGCQLVQELARTLGPALDPHVEMFLQSFIKMSAATKHIAAENGKMTCDAIFQNCSYKHGMMQHIWHAAQDKNAQTRQSAPEWLKTILRRQASYKQHFESSGGLDLAEKSIKKGLDDANPKVKESSRATYWTFAKSWPERANAIMSTLDPKSKTALEKDSNNPNASLLNSQASSAATTARATGAASRNALREMMAEQRKAKAAGRLPDRPNSAMAQLSPVKPRATTNLNNTTRAPSNLQNSSRPEARVASTASTASATPPTASTTAKKGSSLMSGPVRRPRRPEISRPQTADPYGSTKAPLRPETPAEGTPMNSPPKGTANSKTSIPTSSAARNRAKTSGNAAGSPSGSPARASPRSGFGASMQADSRPTSKGSNATNGEDDFTMIMPRISGNVANRAPGFAASGQHHRRAVHGQTMSVDSGIPQIVEDEGFTMVMPNLPQQQQRARSPLAYRSPLKAMFEEAREKIENMDARQEEHVQSPGIDDQITTTPRSASPLKTTTTNTTSAEEVMIYEDPLTADAADAPPDGERKVLGELPVNENVRMQSPTQSSNESSAHSPPLGGSPRSHIPVSSESRSPAAIVSSSTPQDRAEVLRNRRLLGSGIDRIRAKTLDAHGFRRVQDLAKSDLDIWEGGKKYDELMDVLLEYLQTFDQQQQQQQQESRLPTTAQQGTLKAASLKVQALGLVRALLYLHKKNAMAWHGRALVAVLACRKGVDAGSHVLADVERTADDIVKQGAPESCIDAVSDYLSSSSPMVNDDNNNSSRSTAMALAILRQLLDSAKQRSTADLGAERKVRLVQITARYLDAADAEVRKADVELASELFELFGSSKAEFWSEFKGTDEGRLGLLTYYIARRGKAAAAARAQ